MKVNGASAGFSLLSMYLSRKYQMIWVTKDILKRLNGVKKETEAKLTCFVLTMGKNPRFYTPHNATGN